jgi:hypothetical protein
LRAGVVTTLKAHIGFNQGIKSSRSVRDSIHFANPQKNAEKPKVTKRLSREFTRDEGNEKHETNDINPGDVDDGDADSDDAQDEAGKTTQHHGISIRGGDKKLAAEALDFSSKLVYELRLELDNETRLCNNN